MSSFTDDLYMHTLSLSDEISVDKEYSFYSTKFKVVVIIKKGFESDLASIPPIIKSFVRASPIRSFRAYVVHDALYRDGKLPRKKCDLILDEALTVCKINAYARGKVYYGLRMFGSPTTDINLLQNALRYTYVIDCHGLSDIQIKNFC